MMNKGYIVYIVFEDNGEVYEDYYKWIAKVFDKKTHAARFIKNSKAKEKMLCKKQSYRSEHSFWVQECEIEGSGDIQAEIDTYKNQQKKITNHLEKEIKRLKERIDYIENSRVKDDLVEKVESDE